MFYRIHTLKNPFIYHYVIRILDGTVFVCSLHRAVKLTCRRTVRFICVALKSAKFPFLRLAQFWTPLAINFTPSNRKFNVLSLRHFVF